MPQSEYWPFTKGKTAENVEYSDKSAIKQLGDMEGEVKEMQMELAAIKRDRMDLFSRKQSKGFVLEAEEMLKSSEPHHYSPEENFTKYPEVAKLREELIKAKKAADEERYQREKYESKLKDLELKLNNICCAGMITEKKARFLETKKYSDEEITVYKTQIRDMKEEAEELKITLVEKTEQLQEYRIKYLQAQQQVEELKRQLDVIEFDNKQVSDQIQIEIQKMKMQFQEKLQELAPLPDLLKGAQIQLQEAKQLQRLAEDSSQQLSNELHRVKEKLVVAVNNLNQEKVDRSKLTDENKMLKAILDEKTKEIDDLNRILDEYKCKATRNEEKYCQQEIRYKEKSAECSQLARDLDEIKVESNRSLSRCKDRADSMRRYLQTQISELERQLIQSRAHCRACQKERDEIRQRMQIQINNLQENFELVEIRLRALQNQVTSLKNSYTVILADDEEGSELNKISSA
ncbi:spindle pole body component 110-like isoform X2 [Trichoplusia ni]|uniref:Spindle pole body component 110-like isoform X2 n=1 Tax=Trichoplusia ni TaxID=7111 RepID=A0A7E5VHQ3_TRINI|nr:spindle pole body component 110-like isoform X2 [Trichoplusia ni]